MAKLREALSAALLDMASEVPTATMLLDGVEFLPLEAYSKIIDVEAAALRYGYKELHATTPVTLRASPPDT